MFIIMFGGMSMHISQALLCHMFSINMQWGATSKEVENTNFFEEVSQHPSNSQGGTVLLTNRSQVPKIAKKFKYSMAACWFGIIAMIVMALAPLPWSWNITQFVAIFPLAILCSCHILLPIALNPGLMTFTF